MASPWITIRTRDLPSLALVLPCDVAMVTDAYGSARTVLYSSTLLLLPPREPASLSLSSSDSPVLSDSPLPRGSPPSLSCDSSFHGGASCTSSVTLDPQVFAKCRCRCCVGFSFTSSYLPAEISQPILVQGSYALAQALWKLSRHHRIINSFCGKIVRKGRGVTERERETGVLDYATLLRFTMLKNAFFGYTYYCDSRGLR